MTTTTARQAPHHNTLTCYTNYGCRFPACVERKRAWARQRDRELRAGTWQPRIDATPVREHIEQLAAEGITLGAIARAAGVERESIVDFTRKRRPGRGLRHDTSPETAARILSLTPDTITPGRVDATGTHRRIQALIAAGWPLLHIGRQLGVNEQRPEQILRQTRTIAATRDAFANGYERIAGLRPEKHGVPAVKARYSRERAKGMHWPTPRYWASRMDVIDDPDFTPDYGPRRLFIAQEAAWLMRHGGLDRATAAVRLGVHKSAVDHALREHPEYATEAAA